MKVAVGIIIDNQDRILITQRSSKTTHAGFWEFPGGKLEQDETPEAALIREIKEEVNLDVLEYKFLGQIDHKYDAKFISLLIYYITKFNGKAISCEEQTDLKWVERHHLTQFTFPAANQQIIQLLQA